jgi:hypothetical protein
MHPVPLSSGRGVPNPIYNFEPCGDYRFRIGRGRVNSSQVFRTLTSVDLSQTIFDTRNVGSTRLRDSADGLRGHSAEIFRRSVDYRAGALDSPAGKNGIIHVDFIELDFRM